MNAVVAGMLSIAWVWYTCSMTTATVLDALGSARYISLTTFRPDGTSVATPVWVARTGDALIVITDPTSGKAKRLRANPRVRVSPCDMRGRLRAGALSVLVFPLVASWLPIQDEAQTSESVAIITRKYGLMGRILTWMNDRRARSSRGGSAGGEAGGHMGLTITFPGTEPDQSIR